MSAVLDLGAASTALLGALATAVQEQTGGGGEAVLFWVLAPIMVLAGLGLLFLRRAVHAALCLILIMVSLAVLYVAQEAPFLGIVQVVVYTGAVMMLFLFVLMLIGVDASESLVETIKGQRWIGLLFGAGLGVVLVGVITRATYPQVVGMEAANADGNPVGVARIAFGQYVFAFEVVGVLLITAALGAIVLTHRQRLTRKIGQREAADARIASGRTLTPLPAPGVYATSNAMHVPALGPDGRPLEHSIPRVIRVRGQERPAPVDVAPVGAADEVGRLTDVQSDEDVHRTEEAQQ